MLAGFYRYIPHLEASWNPWLKAFHNQSQLIGKLILHYVRTRYKKSLLGYGTAFVEPCSHLLIWWVLMTYIRQRTVAYGMPPLLVIASGLLPFYLFKETTTYLTSTIPSSAMILKHPLVKLIDLILARFILEALTIVAVGTVIFGFLIVIGIAPPPWDFLGIFPPLTALLILGLGIGTFAAFASPIVPGFGKAMSILMRILYLTSGIFFLGAMLPPAIMRLALWNPVFHALELFREAYFHTVPNPKLSIWYPLAWGVGVFLIGISIERVMHRKLSNAQPSEIQQPQEDNSGIM